jgi:sterol desaturase/sphingolipid hydroxylase (fatty acid hydroxylase superfamily)
MDESRFGTRSSKGEWTPFRRASYGPLSERPFHAGRVARWFVTGYLLPWNALYAAVAVVLYRFATPSAATTRTFSMGWISFLVVRNLAIVVLWYGLFHWWLYVRRAQGTRFKYNVRWPREGERFTFGSLTRENVVWALASGVPIWTAYEVVSLWLFSNGHVSWLEWSRHPGWIVAIMLLIPLWREVHFYWIHRLIHTPFLYRTVHSLHHRATNPGPWSGLSMHPVEHVVYYSAAIIHWIIPSHPIHVMFELVHLTMAPVPGHCGFEKIEVGDELAFDTGCLNHYLHHKYFEVNYADGAIPLDRWFGSFHDGSPEAHAAMKHRLSARQVATSD